MRRFSSILLSLAFLFLLVGYGQAQQQLKLVQGELTHEGKPLANQPILVEGQKERTWVDWFRSSSNKIKTITITDERGFFQLINLPPGEYTAMWVRAGEQSVLLKSFKVGYGYDFETLDVPSGSFGTLVLGINDQGDIVGARASVPAPNGFLYKQGETTTISVPNSSFDQVFAINNSGIMAGGYVDKDTKQSRAFIYDGKKFTTIEPPGAKFAYAYGINDQREVVGFYQDDRGAHGFIYAGNEFSRLDFPGVFDTRAAGINNKRQIVGYYYQHKEKRFHGFLFERGAFTTIDYPGLEAVHTRLHNINDGGDIVGFCLCGPHSAARGFLYRDGLFTDIQFPNASETFPNGINHQGSIVGYYNGNGGGHGFRAIPRKG